MQFRHLTTQARGIVTVIAISPSNLESIDEWDYPNQTVAELLDEFGRAVAEAPAGVVVDIRETRTLNHASVAVLARLARVLSEHGRPGVLCCSSQVKEILDLCRINRLCPCWTDLEESVAEIAKGRGPEVG
jgi:anti-anti-sigma regulatory factor